LASIPPTPHDEDTIVAIATPDNHASIHVLEKLGLRFEAMIRLVDDSPEIKLFTPAI